MIVEVPKKEVQIEDIESFEVAPAVAAVAVPVAKEVGVAVMKKIFAPKRKEVKVEVTPTWQKVLPWALGGLGVLLLTIVLLKK